MSNTMNMTSPLVDRTIQNAGGLQIGDKVVYAALNGRSGHTARLREGYVVGFRIEWTRFKLIRNPTLKTTRWLKDMADRKLTNGSLHSGYHLLKCI